ncbi:helix-hairpin-helix domain-containing protein [Albibacterium indicum]|uniref:helix-hairpin-helix domain-containing protein n=1 Tax=Albibacterium indicum TaxID=2292082 RepID=UPI000E51FB22|nr:helix-hairpin-helix domain-containing protein [Pedobacter indicus]
MKSWFLTNFSFSRKEIQGIAFLTCIVIVVWLAPFAYPLIIAKKVDQDFESRKQEIISFVALNRKSEAQESSTESLTTYPTKPEYFIFDPNDLSTDDGRRLGLSDVQVRMIHNYRKSGGSFYKKEDLAKIYSISEDDYSRLAPYINIQSVSVVSDSVKAPRNKVLASKAIESARRQEIMINLNRTDSIELLDLYGIGPAFASRIIKYRNLLGGYHHKDQLLEVYGMDRERFEGFQKNVFVKPQEVQMIQINQIEYRELLKHPYITPRQANTIVQYRNQHGIYQEPRDLLKIEIVDEDFLRKIVPYLSFEIEESTYADNREDPTHSDP